MKISTGVFCFLFLLLCTNFLAGLDYTVGNYQLHIFEDSGRFYLSYKNDQQVIPLFYSDNPRSSSLQLSYNDNIVRLGEEKNITLSIQQTPNSVIVRYGLEDLLVEQIFSFLQQKNVVLGLQLTFRVTNRSAATVKVEIRNIIDTSLGEVLPFHFSTARNANISNEYRFSPSNTEAYIISGNVKDRLVLYLAGAGLVKPREVLAANWKRISESKWEYDLREDNNFTFLPFSINDSALALFFGPATIPSAQSVEYIIAFSHLSVSEDPALGQRNISTAEKYILNPGARDPAISSRPINQQATIYVPIQGYRPEEIAAMAPYITNIEILDNLIGQMDSLLSSSAYLDSRSVAVLADSLRRIQANSTRQ